MITKFIIYNDSIFKSRVFTEILKIVWFLPNLECFFFFFLSRNEMETDQHL